MPMYLSRYRWLLVWLVYFPRVEWGVATQHWPHMSDRVLFCHITHLSSQDALTSIARLARLADRRDVGGRGRGDAAGAAAHGTSASPGFPFSPPLVDSPPYATDTQETRE